MDYGRPQHIGNVGTPKIEKGRYSTMISFILSLIAFGATIYTIVQLIKLYQAYNKLDESYLALIRDYNKMSAENSIMKTELLLKDAIIETQQREIKRLSKETK